MGWFFVNKTEINDSNIVQAVYSFTSSKQLIYHFNVSLENL